MGYAPTSEAAKARTDVHCHECGKGFIAQLDFSINGNHKVICPRCGHTHYRFIKDGVITGERWHPDAPTTEVNPKCVWMETVIEQPCSVAAQFIRDAWLNRSDW
jgi:DNA-directed RNA polymerase subunit RPC12/RpoP